jgi:hypothetical protein
MMGLPVLEALPARGVPYQRAESLLQKQPDWAWQRAAVARERSEHALG